MLVLTRRVEESLLIGDGIEIKIVQVRGAGDQATVRIGISAPPHVRVLRKEVYEEVRSENRSAVQTAVQVEGDLAGILGGLLAAPPAIPEQDENEKPVPKEQKNE